MAYDADGRITSPFLVGTASNVQGSLTVGDYLVGEVFDGAFSRVITVQASSNATPSTLVAYDSDGKITTPFLIGTASNVQGSLTVGDYLVAEPFDGSFNRTITLQTSSNATPNTLIAYDSEGKITTPFLIGTASNVQASLTVGDYLVAEPFDGSFNRTITLQTSSNAAPNTLVAYDADGKLTTPFLIGTASNTQGTLTVGDYLVAEPFDGSFNRTITLQTSSNATPSTLVAYDSEGKITTPFLIGTASNTQASLTVGDYLISQPFDGSFPSQITLQTSSNATPSTLVAYDSEGKITTPFLIGTASNVQASLTVGDYLVAEPFDGSFNRTITLQTSSNATPNTLVAYDADGKITTPFLIGTASNVQGSLTVGNYLVAEPFDGSFNRQITLQTSSNATPNTLVAYNSEGKITTPFLIGTASNVQASLTVGDYLVSDPFDGSFNRQITLQTSSNATPNTLVAYDSEGKITTPFLIGTASNTQGTLTVGDYLVAEPFDGSFNRIITLQTSSNATPNTLVAYDADGKIISPFLIGTASNVQASLTVGDYLVAEPFDGSFNRTITLQTSSNATPSTLVAYDSEGKITTPFLIGTASNTQGTLTVGDYLVAEPFDGSFNRTITLQTSSNATPNTLVAYDSLGQITSPFLIGTASNTQGTLTVGDYLVAEPFDGAFNRQITLQTSSNATPSTLVAYDSQGRITTPFLIGTASNTQGTLTVGDYLVAEPFDGSFNRTITLQTSSNATPSTLVAYDSQGRITTPFLIGTASNTQAFLTVGNYLVAQPFDGSFPSQITLQTSSNASPSTLVAYDPSGSIFSNKIGINTSSTNLSLEVRTTDAILLPSGTTAERPSPAIQGSIRYNSQDQQFEGYGAGNAWGSLGGVKSTDQKTYILATNASNLEFYTAGQLQVILNPHGNLGIGTTSPHDKLEVYGNARVLGTLLTSNLTVIGDFTTINTLTSNTDQLIITNDGTGPALKVTQTGSQPVAEFHDAESGIALYIGDNGEIGIGTNITNGYALTVNGTIRSSYLEGTASNVKASLTVGDYLVAEPFDGAFNRVITVQSSSNATPNTLVAYDSQGRITTPFLIGTASNVQASLSVGNYLIAQPFDGSFNRQITLQTSSNASPSTLVAYDPSGFIFSNKIGINTSSTNLSLEVRTTDAILLPSGTTSERPNPAIQGSIRYNSQDQQFEGYGAGNAWGSLGGVKSPDQQTYILATNASNLELYTAGTLQAILNPQGNLGIGTTSPQAKLEVYGDAAVDGNLTVSGAIVYTNPNSNYTSRFQITPTQSTFIVPPGGQSNFSLEINGLYAIERSNVSVHVNGFKLAYYNTSNKDYDITYTNNLTTTSLYVTTSKYLQQNDVVDIIAWPSYLTSTGTLQPGYVVQNINYSHWSYTPATQAVSYVLGNVGIGTTIPKTSLDVVGNITLQGNIIPSACNVYNLGSPDFRFKDLYLSGNSIDLGGAVISSSGGAITMPAISVTGSTTISVDDSGSSNLNTSNVNVLRLPVEATWAVRVDGPGNDSASSVTIDPSSNLYIGGSYASTTTAPIIYNANNTDSGLTLRVPTGTAAFGVKYNSDGIAQWAVTVDGASVDQVSVIQADSQTNFYLAGQYNGAATIYNANNTDSTLTLRAPTNYSAYVVKYNSTGSAQWAVSADSAGNDNNYGFTVDTGLNVYLAGDYAGTVSVYNAGNTLSTLTCRASSGRAAYLVKYNSSGTAQWTASVDSAGTGSNDAFSAVITDANQNVYLSGNYTSTTTSVAIYNSNNTLSPITIRSSVGQAGFAVKYDSFGTAQWAVSVDGLMLDQTTAIALDSIGNFYLGGTYSNQGPIIYNSNNTLSPITLRNTDGGSFASFLIKYNPSGIAQWATSIDSIGGTAVVQDSALAVHVDNVDNVYLSGVYITGQAIVYNTNNIPSGITLRQPIGTGTSAYGVKYNQNGIAQWAISVDGGATDNGEGILTDAGGNVYLGGLYGANLPAPTIYNPNNTSSPVTLAPSAGGTVSYIVKYNNNQFKLLNNLTQSQQGTLKYVYNSSTTNVPLNIRNSTDTNTISTIQIPARSTEQLLWYNNSWQSLTPTLSPLKGGTGNSNLPYNKLLVTNGPTDPVLTPNNLHWDNFNGRLGIGTTVPSYSLHVVGDIYASGAVTQGSDAALKMNIAPIENALDKLLHLTGYTFNYKTDPTGRRVAGLIAQEVQTVLPEVVYQDNNNLSLAYGNINALIINAIKELQADVQKIKSVLNI